MKKNLKGFILGILFTVLVMQLIMPINAAMLGKTIQVMTGINIYMDDVKLTPKDSKGNSVEPFIYNGTTYLPLRAVAEALNKAVTWEGKTSSVYLGKHDSATPAVMLYDMDYSDCERGNISPMFFRAVMKRGVIDLRDCEVIR